MHIRGGVPGRRVVEELRGHGLDDRVASNLVRDILAAHRQRATVLLVAGCILLALGLVVTLATYSNASSQPGGGIYVVWFGAVIAGFSAAVFALVRLVRLRW
jgi:hypothetical protein